MRLQCVRKPSHYIESKSFGILFYFFPSPSPSFCYIPYLSCWWCRVEKAKATEAEELEVEVVAELTRQPSHRLAEAATAERAYPSVPAATELTRRANSISRLVRDSLFTKWTKPAGRNVKNHPPKRRGKRPKLWPSFSVPTYTLLNDPFLFQFLPLVFFSFKPINFLSSENFLIKERERAMFRLDFLILMWLHCFFHPFYWRKKSLI